MDEKAFRSYLEAEGYTIQSITSRLNRARRIEKKFNINLDEVVQNEEKTLETRELIYKNFEAGAAHSLYNALVRYYNFRNSHELPRKNARNQDGI